MEASNLSYLSHPEQNFKISYLGVVFSSKHKKTLKRKVSEVSFWPFKYLPETLAGRGPEVLSAWLRKTN